jgi:DNA-binding SARP family transcriptional activator/tetratricopeptide (TPR) repeat protein
VDIRVLGPVEATAEDGEPIRFVRHQQRMILGVLAVHLGIPVPSERLVRLVWGDDMAPTTALHTRISELRHLLSAAGDAGDHARVRVVRTKEGYVLEAPESAVDLLRFQRIVEQAQAARIDDVARDLLRDALAMWRGPLLGGALIGTELDVLAHSLESVRLTAAEDLYEIELRLGNEQRVLREISGLADAHPDRERLVAGKLRALHRAGRGVEALHYYDQWRRGLADDLGVDPGAVAQAAYLEILNPDPTPPPDPVFRVATPRILPPPSIGFAGRQREMAEVAEVLAGPARMSVVSGPGGVGKTALCLQIAHGLSDTFRDGQLYADLRGGTDGPLDARDVLARFLRALGVEGAGIPPSLDERTDLFRSLVAERRVLVVLDNAASVDQILPLVPNGPHCATLINTRARLGAALGVHMLDLDVLDEPTAVELLRRMVGEARIDAAPEAAADLARQCGFLPLALRIAGARLAAKPHWRVGTVVDLLHDERHRLDEFRHGHLDVRASIALSYGALSADARRLLRLLGSAGLQETTVWLAAALIDQPDKAAELLLEELFDARLLDVVAGATLVRYRMHDLVLLYAAEGADDEDPPDTLRASRLNTYQAWLSVAEIANRAVYASGFQAVYGSSTRRSMSYAVAEAIDRDPIGWFESERSAINAAVRATVADGCVELAWEITSSIALLLQMRRHFDEWRELVDLVLAAARAAGDRRGVATMTFLAGAVALDTAGPDLGGAEFERAIGMFEELGAAEDAACVRLYRTSADRVKGDHDAVGRGARRALEKLNRASDACWRGYAHRVLAQAHLALGDLPAADECVDAAFAVYDKSPSRMGVAQSVFWQAMIRLRQERFDEAQLGFERALRACEETGDKSGQAQCARGFGMVALARGEHERATEHLTAALRLVVQPRSTLMEVYIRRSLAEVAAARTAA